MQDQSDGEGPRDGTTEESTGGWCEREVTLETSAQLKCELCDSGTTAVAEVTAALSAVVKAAAKLIELIELIQPFHLT
jgi:hypothetical protein